MIELRCDNEIKFGELLEDEPVIEVRCRSRRCGHRPGVVVIHGFDVETGKLLGTRRFAEPPAAWKQGV
jgi:hypothetical protein